MSAAALELDITVPVRDVRLALAPVPGRITAVIGPNGAGKSTLLEAISGTLGAVGSVRIDGREIGRLAPHRRRIGYLQQRAALFEHLSVRENVAFGPRAQGAGRVASRRCADQILDSVGAASLADRRPRSLSGGQAQRVAIARALATDPALLLLDEPFAALDAEVTAHLRSLLTRTLAGRTALLVTHDLLDVLALADDVAVLEAGRLAAIGPRERILARPPTGFAARLTGRELLTGTLEGDAVVTETGLRIPGRPDDGVADGARAMALVDPAAVRLLDDPADARRGGGEIARVRLETIGRLGSMVVLRGGGLGVQIEAERAAARALPAVGEEMAVLLDGSRTPIYAGDHGHDEHDH